MSSTCFEPQGSSSRRRLYKQLRYSTFYMHQYKQSPPIILPHSNNVNRCSLALKKNLISIRQLSHFVIICIVLGDVHVHIVPANTFFIIFSIVSGLSDLCVHG
jgi:hypothetical protein